jgi:hypothetical protein
MIEFEHLATPGQTEQRAPIVLNTASIGRIEPLAGDDDRSLVVLTDGRQLLAPLSYADFRALLIRSRSHFATSLA